MWILVGASHIWSCWMSVLTATKSTWVIPASIMRSTAFSPAPPTPTTRITARYDVLSRARSRRAGDSGSGSSQRARCSRVIGSAAGAAGAAAATGSGVAMRSGVGAGSGSSATGSVGSCCCSCLSVLLPRFAASVARKRSASGPSRILARFLAIEHLLREVTVQRRSLALRLVGKDGRSLHGRLREPHGLADARRVDEVAEVFAQDLVGFTGVRQALVVHRRHDPDDPHFGVQVLAHHRERVLELHEPAQREVLGLHRDDHTV